MSSSDIRAKAREFLSGKWEKAVVLTLVYMLCMFGIGLIAGFIPLGNIALTVIEVPIAYGFIITFLKFFRNEDITYLGFFEDGFSSFTKSWKVTLWILFKLLIPIIITFASIIIMFMFIAGGTFFTAFVAASTGDASSLLGILLIIVGFVIGIVGICVGEVLGIIKAYYYSLAYFIAYDNPDLSEKEAVEKSAKLMEHKRADLFKLDLSFIGWILLATITFGIGFLWVLPYMQIARLEFYDDILKNTQNSSEEKNTDTKVVDVEVLKSENIEKNNEKDTSKNNEKQ